MNFRAGQQGAACARVVEKHADELTADAIIAAEPGTLKIHQAHATLECGSLLPLSARELARASPVRQCTASKLA